MGNQFDSFSNFVVGMAAGAALMYILDPDDGRRRRALLRDRTLSTLNDTEEALEGRAKDMRNRSMGRVADLRGRMRDTDVDDDTLVARVRSELGRAATHPRAIHVAAHDGCVVLGGNTLRGEIDEICAAVRQVRGVRQVQNDMTLHDSAGSISELQG